MFDLEAVESEDDNDASNPAVFQLALNPGTPFHQIEDLFVDIYLTRWGYYRGLTEKELLISDPQYKIDYLCSHMKVKPKLQDIPEVFDGIPVEKDDDIDMLRDKLLKDIERDTSSPS